MSPLLTQLTRYHHQVVRDLAWSCFGPSLIHDYSEFGQGNAAIEDLIIFTPQRQQWLQQLDHDPTPLHDYLATTRHKRLGLYFEALWQFFLKQDEQFDLIANNLPVRNSERTLGEYDLIVFCHRQQRYFHLELAVKFYLYAPEYCADDSLLPLFSRWLGPNCRDRFDRKLQHLTDQQIRLSNTECGQQVLAQAGINEIDTRIALKGALFYPHHIKVTDNPLLNANHWQGQWLSINNIEDILPLAAHWQILAKPQWLSPCCYDQEGELLSCNGLKEALQESFARRNWPLAISALGNNGERYFETARFFITDKQWPSSQLTGC